MSLTKPEDQSVVTAAAAEFLKLCSNHGIKEEQILQTTIAIAASAICGEAKRDRKYALELFDRYHKSLRTSILSQF